MEASLHINPTNHLGNNLTQSIQSTAHPTGDLVGNNEDLDLVVATKANPSDPHAKKSSGRRERKNRTSDSFQAIKDKIASVNSLSSHPNFDHHSHSDAGSQYLNMYQRKPDKSQDSFSFKTPESSCFYTSSKSSLFASNHTISTNRSHDDFSPLLKEKDTFLESEFAAITMNDSRKSSKKPDQSLDPIIDNDKIDLDSLDPRVSILGSMSIFSERPDFLSKLRPFLEFKIYDKGTIVQKQGDTIKTLYWILDGNCTVSQQVSFLQVLMDNEWIMKPEYVNITPINQNERTITKTIESQNLDAGSWFPYLPGIDSTTPLCKELFLKTQKAHACECSIIADSRIIVAQIPFINFVELASISLLYTFHQQTSIYRFNHEFLREEYLAQNDSDKLRSKFPMTFSESISLI